MKKKEYSNRELHRKLWRILARTGSADKKTAVAELSSKGYPAPQSAAECYACDEAIDRASELSYDRFPVFCEYCPIGKGIKECADRSPYDRWAMARREKTRKKYAKIIAELPWRRKSTKK